MQTIEPAMMTGRAKAVDIDFNDLRGVLKAFGVSGQLFSPPPELMSRPAWRSQTVGGREAAVEPTG
jgi:hypothetical protein